MSKKPNILIFNPDQFRADALGHLGNEASVTPNLDTFARQDAVSFRSAFCQNPVCTPSRCSFMSGWYPHVHGHRTMYHMMQENEPVLLKTLKEEGYYIWWGGKNDLVPGQKSLAPYCHVKNRPSRPLRPSFYEDQSWRGPKEDDNYYSFYAGRLEKGNDEVYPDWDWDNVLSSLEIIKTHSGEQPFCIYLPLEYPHPPYGVEEPWYGMIDRKKEWKRAPVPFESFLKPSILDKIRSEQNLGGWTEDRWQELRATYLGMCARIDHQFGMLVDTLKKKGLYEDTAIFVFSDHGDFTGDYGLVEKTQNTFEDVLTHVPFIIKPPAGFEIKPGISDALVELVDFPATVEAITGIKPKHTHFGRSLMPVIAGEKTEHRDCVFCEGGRLAGEEHCKELDSLPEPGGLYWPRLKQQIGDGPEHGKAVMARTNRYKYVRRLYETDELYDLEEDPQELNNRINDAGMRDILLSLKDRLISFFMETGDVVPHNTDSR